MSGKTLHRQPPHTSTPRMSELRQLPRQRLSCDCRAHQARAVFSRRQCLAALFLPGLASAPAVAIASPEWEQARSRAEQAQVMAARTVSTMNGLAQMVERSYARREELTELTGRLGAELSETKRRNEALLAEYRNGMFCSGCNQTRSQILAKGESFPHPGQQVIRPTPQQIQSKEQDLARPVADLSARLDTARLELAAARTRAQYGLEQLVFGLSFWRCALSDASGQLNRALTLRQRLLQEQLQVQRDLYERTLQRASAAQISGDDKAYQALTADAGIHQRQLERRQREVTEAQTQGQVWLARGVELRRQQKDLLVSYLDQRYLRQAAPAVSDASQSPLSSPLDLGVFYLMGSLPASQSTQSEKPAALKEVEDFVQQFKQGAGAWLGVAPATPSAPAPAAAPARPNGAGALSDLLQKLP
jgi:hypothetical protein